MLNFLLETFRLGVKNLRLHKLRSLLTALGIIFGVAAVIIMVAIGQGTKQEALEQMRQLGAQNILVRSVKPPQDTDVSNRTQRTLEYGLTRNDLARLESLPGLTHVVPLRDTEQKVIRAGKLANASAIATTPKLFEVVNLNIARGNFFDEIQFEQAEAVCVLGAQAATDLFPFEDPLGKTVQLGQPSTSTVLLTVIGVLETTGLRAGSDSAGITQRDIDRDIYFPLTLGQAVFGDTLVKRQSGSFERKKIELSEVWLRTQRLEEVEHVADVARNVVALEHPRGRADVEVKAPIQILRNAERLNKLFNFIMVGIASFALVVGGIGIMNIMLATVTERTREIGIRRALGAKQNHITLQFLVETTVISLSGGLIGILLGMTIAIGLPYAVGLFASETFPTSITSWSVIGSFVVSGMIGIGFGLYPAVKAAKMNPIEALRRE